MVEFQILSQINVFILIAHHVKREVLPGKPGVDHVVVIDIEPITNIFGHTRSGSRR